VTTFRIDGKYSDFRRPSSVTFSSSIVDDLSRRDFTINAVAYSPDTGFIDPFDGRGDIRRKIIRCVGRAEHRFGEDALRILRAVRFASQLGFSVELDTLNAIPVFADNLRHVSAERIREELTRILLGEHPSALALLKHAGLLRYVVCGREYRGDLNRVIGPIGRCPKCAAMVYALFLACFGGECREIMKDLRFDIKTLNETATYIKWLLKPVSGDRYGIKKALNILTPDVFDKLLVLKISLAPEEHVELETIRAAAADILANGECFTLRGLAVNGGDLLAAGVPGGKALGDTLSRLLDAVMLEPELNKKDRLLALL